MTDYCFGDPMCDKCTIPMSRSYWNDIQIFYSTSPKSNTGFYCVVCALKKSKTTIYELNKKYPKKETKQESLISSNGVN